MFIGMGLWWTIPVVVVCCPSPSIVRFSRMKAMITAVLHALMVLSVQPRMPPVFGDRVQALDMPLLRRHEVTLVPARLRFVHAFVHNTMVHVCINAILPMALLHSQLHRSLWGVRVDVRTLQWCILPFKTHPSYPSHMQLAAAFVCHRRCVAT